MVVALHIPANAALDKWTSFYTDNVTKCPRANDRGMKYKRFLCSKELRTNVSRMSVSFENFAFSISLDRPNVIMTFFRLEFV